MANARSLVLNIQGYNLSEPINYRKIVNQQFAGAAFQLSLIDSKSLQLSKIQINSCIQANVQHLLLAIEAYINEILSNYKRTTIDFISKPIDQLFLESSLTSHSIVELNEFQQWYEDKASNFYLLFHLKMNIMADSQSTISKQNNNVIAVSNGSDKNLFSSVLKLQELNKNIVELIDRQRESLLEH